MLFLAEGHIRGWTVPSPVQKGWGLRGPSPFPVQKTGRVSVPMLAAREEVRVGEWPCSSSDTPLPQQSRASGVLLNGVAAGLDICAPTGFGPIPMSQTHCSVSASESQATGSTAGEGSCPPTSWPSGAGNQLATEEAGLGRRPVH